MRYLRIIAIVMAGALLFALVLSHGLQKTVTTPILTVADAARRVIEHHDYGVRVAPQSGKEAALLADAFNQMLAEIDKRTSSLEQEMSERRQAEQALLEADKRKDEFLATLAHELRNPLAPIVTSVEVLKRLGMPEGPQRKAHEVIDRQARHMTRLLDDLLDVARITNGKVQLQMQRLSLASVLDAAIESTRHLLEGANHRLALHLPDEPLYVEGDAVRLAQVFTNLLTNACKYMEPGGMVTVTLAPDGARAKVVVADRGIGIRKKDQARVFALFTQSETSAQRFDGGSGSDCSWCARSPRCTGARDGRKRGPGQRDGVHRAPAEGEHDRGRARAGALPERSAARLSPHPGRRRQSRCRRDAGRVPAPQRL